MEHRFPMKKAAASKAPVKKTANKPGLGRYGNLPGPGPGRPKGVPNKFNGELKEAILAGVNGSHKLGVSGFVLKLSLDTPTSAAALLGRLIPVSMVGTLGGKIVVVHRDETAGDEPPALEAKPEEPDGA